MAELSSWRRSILFLVPLSLWLPGCKAADPVRDVPDLIGGQVVDNSDNQPLVGAEITVLLTEREFSFAVGPEGTVRPKIRRVLTTRTGPDGKFRLILKHAVEELGRQHAGMKIGMHKLSFSMQGYASQTLVYTDETQIVRMNKLVP